MLVIVIGDAGRIAASSPGGQPRQLQRRKLLRGHPTRAPGSPMAWALAAAAQAARPPPLEVQHLLPNLHHCTCPDETPGAVVISSEPLTANWTDPENCPEWEPIPEDSIITVSPDYHVEIETLEVSKRPTPPPLQTAAV